MDRPPQDPKAGIWSGGLGTQASWVGALIGIAALAVGYAYHEAGRSEWQTMIFTSLAFLQVFQALATRSNVDSLRTIGLRTNPVMLLAVGVVTALQTAALYSPLNGALDLEPLGLADLGVCVALGVALLVVLETEKAVRRFRAARTERVLR
jgi:Ca2+-transporting ATPase